MKRAKESDERVIALLDGNGSPVMAIAEICEKSGLHEEDVRDSLDRLEAKGRVRMVSATFDSPSSWFSIHR